MDTPNKLGDILSKSGDDTNLDCGCHPTDRSIEDLLRNGVVIIDKPPGPTSHQVSSWVKAIFGFSKAGHSGTLDPKVTGLLPVALESSTKLVIALLSSGKEYVGIMRVHDDLGKKEIQNIFQELTGPLYQKPPVKSAVKRILRLRNVYDFELIEKDGQDIVFRVSCEAGTYIRKLIHDAGLILGCGAHMAELRRTRVGLFTEEDAVILQDVKDAYVAYKEEGCEDELRKIIHPIEDAVAHLHKIWLKNSAVGSIAHGSKLMAPGVTRLHDGIAKGEMIAFMTEKNEVVALAKALATSAEIMAAKKGVIAKPTRVIMETNTYPKIWGDKK